MLPKIQNSELWWKRKKAQNLDCVLTTRLYGMCLRCTLALSPSSCVYHYREGRSGLLLAKPQFKGTGGRKSLLWGVNNDLVYDKVASTKQQGKGPIIH